jgi:hypothetical protein
MKRCSDPLLSMREIQRHHHAFDYSKNPSATSADPFCSRTLLLFVCNLAVLINLQFLSAVAGDGILARRSILVDVFPCDLIILFRVMTLILMRFTEQNRYMVENTDGAVSSL